MWPFRVFLWTRKASSTLIVAFLFCALSLGLGLLMWSRKPISILTSDLLGFWPPTPLSHLIIDSNHPWPLAVHLCDSPVGDELQPGHAGIKLLLPEMNYNEPFLRPHLVAVSLSRQRDKYESVWTRDMECHLVKRRCCDEDLGLLPGLISSISYRGDRSLFLVILAPVCPVSSPIN